MLSFEMLKKINSVARSVSKDATEKLFSTEERNELINHLVDAKFFKNEQNKTLGRYSFESKTDARLASLANYYHNWLLHG